MHIKIEHSCLVLRLSLLLMGSVAIYLSTQLLQLAHLHKQSFELMENIRMDRSTDYQGLLSSIESMRVEGVILGVHSDFRARAGSMVYAKSSRESPISHEQVVQAYREALIYRPNDGYLWATLALHKLSLGNFTEDSTAALEDAIANGKNDYRALKILSHIAIRFWPRFDCMYKSMMYGLLERARMKNDDILNQWSHDNQDMRLGKYIDTMSRLYNFDPRWAENQVMRCLNEEL